MAGPEEQPPVEEPTPEEECKQRVRGEFELLDAQSDMFDWQLRILDAGDYFVIFARIEKAPDRVFVEKLVCDDYGPLAPAAVFIDPGLFESADENTPGARMFYPTGEQIDNREPLPRVCIKGHRDYYAENWHGGWTNPPEHEHTLYQHVVNIRNAILEKWT
jgi:hypothetical protein